MNNNVKPQNQGEGDRESARRYNENVEKFNNSGEVEKAAERAKTDVDGPEGETLRQAEREGKKRIAEEDPEVRRKGNVDEKKKG